MTTREVTMILCPFVTAAMPRNNTPGQEFVVADGLRRPSLQKRRKSVPVRKAAAILRRDRLKPVLPNPKTGEPGIPT
jgi:hypothetical protein